MQNNIRKWLKDDYLEPEELDQKKKLKKYLTWFWKETRKTIIDMRLRTQQLSDNMDALFGEETIALLAEVKRRIYIDVFMPSNTNAYYIDEDRETLKQQHKFVQDAKNKISVLNSQIKDKDFVAFLLLGGFEKKITKETSLSDLFSGDILNNHKDVISLYLQNFDYTDFDAFKEGVIDNFFPVLEAESDYWAERIDDIATQMVGSVSYSELLDNLLDLSIARIKLIYNNITDDFSSIVEFVSTEPDKEIKKKQSAKFDKQKELDRFDVCAQLMNSDLYEKFCVLVKSQMSDNDGEDNG